MNSNQSIAKCSDNIPVQSHIEAFQTTGSSPPAETRISTKPGVGR